MKKTTDYKIAKKKINSLPIELTKKELTIKKNYLLSLKKYDQQKQKLPKKDYTKESFNSITNVILANEIIKRLNNNDKTAFNIMLSELKRLNIKSDTIHKYKREEMKKILIKHIDITKVEEILDFLYPTKNILIKKRK